MNITEETWRESVRRAALLEAPVCEGEAVELVEVARAPSGAGYVASYVAPNLAGSLDLQVALYTKPHGFAAKMKSRALHVGTYEEASAACAEMVADLSA